MRENKRFFSSHLWRSALLALLCCLGFLWTRLAAREASRSQLRVSVITTAVEQPVVTSFEPSLASVGTQVKLHGVNLTNSTHVFVNGEQVDAFRVNSDSEIVFDIPERASTGKIALRLGDESAESVESLVVVQQPELDDFSPDSAAINSFVRIYGKGLLGLRQVRFNGTPANRFWVLSDSEVQAFVPDGASSGEIVLVNDAGSTKSLDSLLVLPKPGVLIFHSRHDTYVTSSQPDRGFGGREELQAKDAPGEKQNVFMKFDVIGLWTKPEQVRLELLVTNDSNHGGALFQVSNNYGISQTPWIENVLAWSNAPLISGDALDEIALIELHKIVSFNVTDVVQDDGIYSFALSNRSADVVRYSSSEGQFRPRLVAVMPSVESSEDSSLAMQDRVQAAAAGGFSELPDSYLLRPNYPNPFNAETRLEYGLPEATPVKLVVYNLLGQKVRVLLDQFQEAGFKSVRWDGRDGHGRSVGSGIFFVQMRATNFNFVRKILLQR